MRRKRCRGFSVLSMRCLTAWLVLVMSWVITEASSLLRRPRGACKARRSTVFEQSLLEPRRGLEEEHQHCAALGRGRRMAAALGADDEIAGGAFALVVDQRAFEHEGLLQVLVHV